MAMTKDAYQKLMLMRGVGVAWLCKLIPANTDIIVSGDTTDSSATVSNINDTGNLKAGMSITGAGIPDSTTIQSVDSATEITLSASATATASSVSLTCQSSSTSIFYASGDSTNRMLFNNCGTDQDVTISLSESSTSSEEEKISIERADGTVFEAVKENLVMKIDTGEIVSGGSDSTGGKKGKLKISVNSADMDSSNYAAFAEKLERLIGSKFLICLPLGFSGDKKYKATGSTNAAVFAFMVGEISSDVTIGAGGYEVKSVSLQFDSKEISGASGSDFDAIQLDAIVLPSANDGTNFTGSSITPPALTTADGNKLIAGRMVIK